MSEAKTIHLVGDYRRNEKIAVEALSPGHLLELTSADKVQKQSTANVAVERLVAIEDVLQGKTITQAYAIDDLVSHNVEDAGAEAQVFIKAGEDLAIGDKVAPAGDGTLAATTASGAVFFASMMEAVDLSASGAIDTLAHVRLL